MLPSQPSRVIAWQADLDPRLTALALRLGLPLQSQQQDPDALYLFYRDDALQLGRHLQMKEHPVKVDFAELWRQRGRGKELLLKAIGGRRSALNVVDATAGLGRDSLLLASYGARVQMCERHPVVHALLEDGLRRGLDADHSPPEVVALSQNLNLQPGAAQQFLHTAGEVDVVYLDPMFPESKKSALVKKEMRLFHHLVGQDEDGEQLLRAALAGARHRVVVKRPPHAPCLNGPAPQLAISGKAVRFDVYPLKAFAKG